MKNLLKLFIRRTELKNRMSEMYQLNIEFDYDSEADVLYITLGSPEPSYCEEVDDVLLVERGMFSNDITGFRILDIKYHKIKEVQINAYIEKAVEQVQSQLEEKNKQRKMLPSLIKENLEKSSAKLDGILREISS